MSNKLIEFFMIPIVFFLLLIDGQISTLATNWSVDSLIISSHLLLMVAIFYANYVSLKYSFLVFMFLGLIYDTIYFRFLGIATTLFPLIVVSIYFFYQAIEYKRGVNVLVLLVSIFQFELISYLFARIFQITHLSLFNFVFTALFPSLVFNIVLFVILQPFFEHLFGITNKT